MYVDMRTQTWPRSLGINIATHKSQSCCLFWHGCIAQSAEVTQLWCLGMRGVAPKLLHTAAGYTHVFAALVAVKVQPRVLAAEQRGHPCTFWNVPLTWAGTQACVWGCGHAFLFSFTACPACETSILAPSARKHEWKMQLVAAQRALCRRQNTYTMDPKLEPQIWKLGY